MKVPLGKETFKETCDPLGLTFLCLTLVSEPAVTCLVLSSGIMGYRQMDAEQTVDKYTACVSPARRCR